MKYFLLIPIGCDVFALVVMQSVLDPAPTILVHFMSIFLSTAYMVFFAHIYLTKVKFKYDGDTLLSLTSYSRRQLVLANYLFTLCSFLLSVVIALVEFWVRHLLLGTELFSFWIISVSFFLVTLMIAFLFSLEYQFGLMNAPFLSMLVVFVVPVLLTLDFSLRWSITIYEKKDL